MEVAAKLANAEVDYLNSGSFVSDSDNPRVALSELNKIFKKPNISGATLEEIMDIKKDNKCS